MKKIVPVVIVAVVIVGCATFFCGMKYATGKGQGKLSNKNGAQNFANLSAEERQQRFGQNSGRMGGGQAGNMVSGEILSKDDKSITVKLRDGGSKIIFFSDSTEISKFDKGAATDLETGKTVVVSGQTNQDGSVTAKTIQLRPEMPVQPPKQEPAQK